MPVDYKLIEHCSEVASNCMSLRGDLIKWLFGMYDFEILIMFRGMPFVVEEFNDKVSHAVHVLVNIMMFKNGQNAYFQLEIHSPAEFYRYNVFIQGVARRALSKVGADHDYHLLVPVAHAIKEIIDAAGGLKKVKAILAKRQQINGNNVPALPFFG